jgi:putative ABC transport system permease protein
VQSRDDLINSLDPLLESIKLLIVILLLAATILGSVVLYNLGSLSFTERIRELATLKVLGYFSGELRSLLNKQNIWMTLIGILLGIPAGIALIRILLSAMSDSMDFVMVISPLTYVVSITGTFLLSMCISLAQARKIRGIDMVGSLKSAE